MAEVVEKKELKDDFILLGKEEMLKYAERIKSDMPYCGSMHNSLLLHARGHGNLYEFYCISGNSDAHIIIWNCKAPMLGFGLYCLSTETEQLMETLKETSLINWDGTLCFFHVPEFLLESLQALVKEKTGQEFQKSLGDLVWFEEEDELLEASCPDNFRICRLNEVGTRRLYDAWKYKCSVHFDTLLALTQNVPSVGIYPIELTNGNSSQPADANIIADSPDSPVTKKCKIVGDSASAEVAGTLPSAGDDEKPVSWITTNFFGAMGMFQTAEGYHNQGFGRVAAQSCALWQLQEGYLPHAYLEEEYQNEDDKHKILHEFGKFKGPLPAYWLWQVKDDEFGRIVCPSKPEN